MKENSYELALIELFTQDLGYQHEFGGDIERDFDDPLYSEVLLDSLMRLNPKLDSTQLQLAIDALRNIDAGSLVIRNRTFMDYLQNGIPVTTFDRGESHTELVRLLDTKVFDNNDFRIINQWTFCERGVERRLDLIVFVNGLPLVVMELKSPSREETGASEAYLQLKNYMDRDIPSLFVYNAFCVMSDMTVSKAGTITSSEDRFMEWKTVDGSSEDKSAITYDTFMLGMFEKSRLIDILQSFICFDIKQEKTAKILAGYHQYYAVKNALASVVQATYGDGRGGVFWHTQGSGKSLSMVFLAHELRRVLGSPTIVVITDRNDLDDQLFGQFSRCAEFLREHALQAESRKNLKELLARRKVNGIIFSTLQKFEESDDALSERRDIIVMADEAHRSQYGLNERVVTGVNKTGEFEARVVMGQARKMRECLPNATFIGFTGTPISTKDRSTREVFGDYISVYDMTQAVQDGATVPVYYENRVVRLKLKKDILDLIDAEYDALSLNADPYAIETSKRSLCQMEAVLGDDATIDSLVDDILDHYEHYRQNLLTGKAMIVAYSRGIAFKIYDAIRTKRPTWFNADETQNRIALVMTESNKDPEAWRGLVGNKAMRTELGNRFKDDTSPLKIVIVVDMWLTGFDVPSLATMYVYKPMKEHGLMQAIARVNRVFPEKTGGLVVDYAGIARALKEAMHDYTGRDQHNYGDQDVKTAALPKFLEKLEVCRDLFFGFDYTAFISGSNLQKAQAIKSGVDFMLALRPKTDARRALDEKQELPRDVFIKEALILRQSLSLCSSLVSEHDRFEAAFFDTIRTMLVRLLQNGSQHKFSLSEINSRINELLKQSIQSDGVINLFSDVKHEFSLFDPKFLAEVARMQQKNLAVELLKKLLKDQVSTYKHTNLVKSEKFSELLQQVVNRYINGMISNEETIQELLNLAKDISNAHQSGKNLKLTDEELAFYDALARPQGILDIYQNDELVALTQALTDMLRKSRTIDWQLKESARADMRRLVKRLLKKYKYPPEGMEEAIETVIKQCELWTDNSPTT